MTQYVGELITMLVYVILANTVGDYLFQSDSIASKKATNDHILFIHSVLYTFGVLVVSHLVGIEITVFQSIFITAFHVPIDYFKASGISGRLLGSEKLALLLEQIMYYIILFIGIFVL